MRIDFGPIDQQFVVISGEGIINTSSNIQVASVVFVLNVFY